MLRLSLRMQTLQADLYDWKSHPGSEKPATFDVNSMFTKPFYYQCNYTINYMLYM